MLTLTPKAVEKIKEIMTDAERERGCAIRFGVRGGGCSGFEYAMQFENEKGPMDKEFDYNGLKVLIDATSFMYLDGTTVDYMETLESSGFKFDNPNATSCGCGHSFRKD